MCGIVAALPVYDEQAAGSLGTLLATLPEPPCPAAAVPASVDGAEKMLATLRERVAGLLADLGRPGMAAQLTAQQPARQALADSCRRLAAWLGEVDGLLDTAGAASWDAETTEAVQATLRTLADLVHGVRYDRVEVAERAAGLACDAPPAERAAVSYLAVETVLAALNRLEVRGRDSAGLTIWVHLDAADRAGLAGALADRGDPLFRSGSAVPTTGGACLVYKRAAVVGRLGDNVAALRRAVQQDRELHRLLALPSARVTVLAHTRWASVGRISEANAHPVDSRGAGRDLPFAIAALNGDIDNYTALQERAGHHPDELGISTDAKVIPLLLAQRLAGGGTPGAALTGSLAEFAGSMAIVAQPDTGGDGELLVAVKGSGQSLYVGLGAAGFLVASEVYGLVGATSSFLRVAGAPWQGSGRPGTVVRLSRVEGGTLAGLRRWDGDGTPRPVHPDQIRLAEVTTRDLALGSAEHYLQKEIHEAPASFRTTLRGRIQPGPAGPVASLPGSSLPAAVRERLRTGEIRELTVIGQGTAAVAGRGIAELVRGMLGDRLAVSDVPASEFSAWRLRPDMTGTCVLAVSQSGTTTDTNRSVDLARERGAAILSIVNRRDSDLVSKSDGVLYTSDGRDVEMAVASTKAFYAQVAAGCLLGIELAQEMRAIAPARAGALLDALRQIPDRLLAVQALEPRLARAAELVTGYPYWTVVGSGPNRVAAAEIRIKLSELCYKTVSTDAVEDKKHIDLSAEALVLVCVAGAPLNQLSDLVKEVEILAAHGNRPVVLCDEGTESMWRADQVVGLPACHPDLAWILSTAAGHLFAYHAARTIDRTADPARLALARLEAAVDAGHEPTADLPPDVIIPVAEMLDATGRGALRGVLTSQAAIQLARLVTLPRGDIPATLYATGGADPASAARAALTAAIDELARPIDTVKHQAKTVTVGTSRDDADLYDNDVVAALQDAGTQRHGLTLLALRVLRAHAGVIGAVTGVTRYQIEGEGTRRTIRVVRKTGSSTGLPSRADRGAPLSGSKRRIADLQLPRLLKGRSDGRIVLVVPERDDRHIECLSVVHLALRADCPTPALVAALGSAGDRLADIEAAVTETAPSFTADRLRQFSTEEVLLAPVEWLAERLASGS